MYCWIQRFWLCPEGAAAAFPPPPLALPPRLPLSSASPAPSAANAAAADVGSAGSVAASDGCAAPASFCSLCHEKQIRVASPYCSGSQRCTPSEGLQLRLLPNCDSAIKSSFLQARRQVQFRTQAACLAVAAAAAACPAVPAMTTRAAAAAATSATPPPSPPPPFQLLGSSPGARLTHSQSSAASLLTCLPVCCLPVC